MKKAFCHIAGSLLLVLLWGCSAQKNTGLSRAYHNLTAKYNVLFNGQESYEKGLEKIEKEFTDDFSEILPIFTYSGKDAAAIASADMDRTIKKCSKLITLHSITAKPKVKDKKNLSEEQRAFFSKKEYNAFVDDAWLLMGKAHFYKLEYDLASEAFKKVINDFKNDPNVFNAQLWLARLSIQTGQYINASELLAMLLNHEAFPKKLLPELYPTYADYCFKQKDYAKTISFLEKATTVEKRKRTRTRYLYILAQLYEKTGDLKRASECYQQVIQMNPVYDMAFNAHINMALAYEKGFGKGQDIENELNKMLHDDKNLDYQDQIYYALGNLAIKEGNEEKALEYYTRSVDANKGNEQQLARSYITIANLYYARPDYPSAQAYYDSAVSNIDADYPGYNTLFTKSKSLTRLVTEINAVKLADSVLLLAKLPADELNNRITALIEAERKKEEEARIKAQEQQLDQQFGDETARRSLSDQKSIGTAAQWYFYNDAAKNLGYREFKLRWGNRKLEDHWQRASKAMINYAPVSQDDEENDATASSASADAFSKTSRDYYLSGIPTTDSAVNATHQRAELGLYNMGIIYKDELKDYEKAAESFKELIKRYPASTYLLASYYNLYAMARDQNNQALLELYKNNIIRQFPESMYARVLTNPEYFKELEKEELAVRQYYEKTYSFYLEGNSGEVIARSDYAKKTYPEHVLIPRFDYLGILAQARTLDRNSFRQKLTDIATQYPGTDIASDAGNLISYMDKEHPELKEAEEFKISQKLYQPSPDTTHHFAFVLDKKINTNQLVFNIINFNLDAFDKLNLIVEIVDLNKTQSLIAVKSFTDREQVMQYLSTINKSEEIYKDMPGIQLIPFAISLPNLKTLLDDKSADRYLKFFKEHYQ
ncbi:MAG: tetratricopeptide repeat protein [Bacteroidales bacterium]|nr:tetratricopeptide repeat protein [Bacteroidales bacterium]